MSAIESSVEPDSAERPLYASAAIVAALVMLAGFAPTYYLKALFGAPDLSVLKHLHGVIMTAWFVLFVVQARAVATGRIAMHRQLGAAGIVLAGVLVAVAMSLAITSARAGVTPEPGLSPLVFLVVPVGEMLVFATLFGTAIALRKRPAYHKRLMLVASVAMLAAAFARFPFDFIRQAGPPAHFVLTDLVLLACIAFDTVRNRRIHPAFVAALAFVVVIQVGRLAISGTAMWMTFAKWLVA